MNVNAVHDERLVENISLHTSDPAETTTRTPVMCWVFCRAYFALRNVVAWS